MAIEKEAPEEVGVVIKYNLSESAISDQTLKSLNITFPPDTALTYAEHKGSHAIRCLVAKASGKLIDPDDVLITAGASMSLFIIKTALLGPKDHVVVTRPNYATNLEIPRSVKCDITFIDLEFESEYRLDIDCVAAAIRPGSLARLAKERGCYLLVDETYSELKYPSESADGINSIPSAASLGDHVISVSSVSKAYGVPGIRIGWLTTTNVCLQETFLAAKEQIAISGSVLDELVAEQILSRQAELLSVTIADMRKRRDHVASWVAEESEWLDWVRPEAGVMCFIKIKKEPVGGIETFYTRLLEKYGVYIGRGGWFERDDSFFRLGYGWPTWQELEQGLCGISKALRE
ncbi:PKS/NRPS-like protein biosynthetic cluster [Penicillium atrosanguineum]|nr:PKS/NRPS-like protein biosynthetic cluster [Penicillium atrosanguineum]